MGLFRNYLAALKASRKFGAALKLQRSGNDEMALSRTHQGLATLTGNHINRYTPHTSAVLIQLTALCEQLASNLDEEGASKQDLEDTHINITRTYGDSDHKYHEMLKYIEVKLGYVPKK